MQKSANDDQDIADFAVKEHRSDPERQDVKISERDGDRDMIRVSHGGNRPENQYKRQPPGPGRAYIRPEKSLKDHCAAQAA
jgi:hypothetical protein